ncbi:hypothetical protein [Pseudactinotalea suaedae]|uniref:hypothetical protein n=1 Tax=Pseudactinotalea suaedae TaxID=1524924 RepID=UPI0012E2B337|nr:hypothetical protein [Pseudactinotalea suaedae]
MLMRDKAAVEAGTITLTFRRWKRPQVLPGRLYRTVVGRLAVDAVEVVPARAITRADAVRAGYPSAAALLRELPGDPGLPIYRVEFHLHDGPDERDELAHRADLTPGEIDAITTRLDRLDRASSSGPWTRQTLELIAANPERRAPDLATMVGRERDPFKLDVRKLKNLGLTLSFPVGYRVSPRGESYLAATRPAP